MSSESCGCTVNVTRLGGLRQKYQESAVISKCPMCSAAPALLAACKRFLEYGDIYCCRAGQTNPYEDAKAAIQQAEAIKP